MGLKKCPICELNYIDETKELCDICLRARRSVDDNDDYSICILCGEHTAVSDKGLCVECLRHKALLSDTSSSNLISEVLITSAVGDVDIDSGLESMELPLDTGDIIPESEYKEIVHDLALDVDDEEEEFLEAIDEDDSNIDRDYEGYPTGFSDHAASSADPIGLEPERKTHNAGVVPHIKN